MRIAKALLSTTMLVGVGALTQGAAQAQTVWTGANSTDWFTGTNWSAGVPAPGVEAIVNTANARDPLVAGGVTGRAGRVVVGNNIGQSGALNVTGALTVDENSLVGSFIVGNLGTGTVTVSGGGDLITGLTGIGNFGTGVGTVNVTGAGSTWTVTSAVDIGSSGNGTLNVSAGGVVSGGVTTNIGNDPGAVGALNVTGTGSSFGVVTFLSVGAAVGGTGSVTVSDNAQLNGGIFTVGNLGQGTLLVESGADASGSTVTIGGNATGTATVTGAGSTLTSTASTIVGASATGTLTVSAGGVVNSGTGRLGTTTTGNGTATFTGAGTRWNVTNDLVVGEAGTGTLNIQAGAVVAANRGIMGSNPSGSTPGANGTITVTGAGSQLNITTSLQTGLASNVFGTGALNVLNGGAVTVGSGQVVDNLIANNSTAIVVDGTGSQLTITPGVSGALTFIRLGMLGVNSLDVTNGGTVSFDRAGFNTVAGSSVAVTVDGATTTWSSNGFTLGGGGTASFVISNGASVNTGAVEVSANATGAGTSSLTISSGGSLTSTAPLGVNITTGTLTLNSGGDLTANSLTIGGSGGGPGATASVTGIGSTLTTIGSLNVANGSNGTLQVSGGASVATGNVGIASGVAGTGTVTVSGAGTTWTANSAGLTIIGVGALGSLTIETGATMTVAGGVGHITSVNGALIVRDAGSMLQSRLAVGSSNGVTSTVQVLNGAVIQGLDGSIGVTGTAIGIVTVDGANSRWTMTGDLDVGVQATGTLNIQNNGTVSAFNAYIGCCANGVGTVNVTGSGALFEAGGTLRVGDSGNGTLNVTAGGDVTSAAALIGASNGGVGAATVTGAGSTWTNAGTLAVGGLGTGTLTVADSGVVTSTGAVSINALSTLNIGAGAVAGTLNAPSIANAGTVRFNHTGTVMFGTQISGTGAFVKDAAGTTVLTADNTFTGVTTINAGTLQIGNGGATGAIAGNVTNNAILAINRTGTLTYGGVISGGGVVNQDGTGTTIFTGNNTYTGLTTISAGTLQLGNGGTSGTIAGNVLNNGTLAFNRSNASTFAGAISGIGNVVHDGTGTTNLTGTSTYNGTTTINAGTLAVNGSITNSAVTVNAAGTLGGNGTVGATNVFGTVSPGNSIGTLNVIGPYVQSTGSTYVVEIIPGGGPGTSDLINVTGTATIQNGTTVSVLPGPGAYTTGTRYTILTATGPVTGTYTNLIDNSPFLDFALAYDLNNVYLDITRAAAMFASIAQTPNQRAAAGAAENLGPGNPIFNAIVPLDVPNALRAFDLLSGEIHASVKGTVLEESRLIRETVIGRLRQSADGFGAVFSPQTATLNFADDGEGELLADASTMSYASAKRIRDTMAQVMPIKAPPPVERRTMTAWGQVFGNWGLTGTDGNAATLNRTSAGFFTGLDATVAGFGSDTWRGGFAGGYHSTSINVRDRSSSGNADTYHLAAYFGGQRGPLGLRAGSSYAWSDISANRNIMFPGFADMTRTSYNARTAQAFAETGYAWRHRKAAFEAFAGVAYVNVNTDGFSELGGPAALAGTQGSMSATFSNVGLRAAAPLPWSEPAGLTARASVAWRHAFGTVTPTAQLAFAGSGPFIVAGVPIARDAAVLELGIDGRVGRNGTLGLAYAGQIAGGGTYDHGATAKYLYRF